MERIKSLFLPFVLLVYGSFSVAAQVRTDASARILSYEKRLVLSYLLAGADESPEVQNRLVQRLQKTVKAYSALPPQEIKLRQFSEFLEAYRGPWPNSNSLNSDLQLIEKGMLRGPVKFRAGDSGLQTQIDRFMATQNQDLLNQSSSLLAIKLQELKSNLGGLNLGSLKGGFNSIKESILDHPELVTKGFELVSKIYQQQVQVINQIGPQIAQSGQLNQMDPNMKLFIEAVLQNYFSRLGSASKKQIVSQFLSLDLNATSMEKFEVLLMSGGPQFQKLMQIVSGGPGLDPAFQTLLKKLESKVSPVPPVLVQELFERERSLYHWNSFELKPLGTGTMAQVHKGSIPTANGPEDVVIRFLKPGIDLRVKEDGQILLEIAKILDADSRFKKAGLPRLLPVVQDLNQTIMDELDLQATIRRQKQGRQVYNQTLIFRGQKYKTDLKINVPDVIQLSPNSNLMVQELISGKKLHSEAELYHEMIPDLEKIIIENIAKMWIEEVIYKSGFFHSDLHQGNFMVDVQDPRIQLNILDFGMGGVLTKDAQSQILLAVVGITLSRADLVARGYWAVSSKAENQISQSELTRQIEQRMKSQKASLGAKEDFSQWTSWAMDQGLKFPYEFVSMNRGVLILDQALKSVGSTQTLTDFAEKLAPKYARNIYVGWRARELLSNTELIRLGWDTMIQSATPKKANDGRPNDFLFSSQVQCKKVYSKSKWAGLFDLSIENLLQF